VTYEEFIESLRDFSKNKPIEWNEHAEFSNIYDGENKVWICFDLDVDID
jgi:hypothetical protein